MATIEMSVSDWANVPENPRQRNTAKRALKAAKGHLRRYSKSHQFVSAATKDGEILCKLDGHTRSFLWQSGQLETPPSGKVTVLLYEVSSVKEAKELYDEMDSARATKAPSDVVYGACRENKMTLTSGLLRSCQFITQLKVADSGTRFSDDPYILVRRWKRWLLELDDIGLSSSYTVLIATMLVSFRKDGAENAATFWKMLDNDEGTKDSRGPDGVQALSHHMALRRAQGRTAGYGNLIDMLRRSWWCYSEWRMGRRIKGIKDSPDVMDVISKWENKKEMEVL